MSRNLSTLPHDGLGDLVVETVRTEAHNVTHVLKTRMHCYTKPDETSGLEGMRFLTQGEWLAAQ